MLAIIKQRNWEQVTILFQSNGKFRDGRIEHRSLSEHVVGGELHQRVR